MKKVYVVTSGEYSDYGIDAIFATEEEANKFVNEVIGNTEDNYDVIEWELNTIKEKYTYEIDIDWESFNVDNIRLSGRHGRGINYISYSGYSKRLNLCVQADTAKRAIKIASERLTQIKALEDIKFPYLRKCIPYTIGVNRGERYPTYNYITGCLVENFEHEYDVEAPRERFECNKL